MKEQIFLLHNLEFVWTLDKKNKRKENLLTTLVISAWQEHIHWLYPSVTFFVSKFWRSCEKSYGNSVNTLWSALKALTRKYALSSNCYFQSWLISFKSLVKAHRVCRLSYFWNIKLKLLRKVSNPGPSNFGLIIGFHLSNFSLKSFMSIELNLKGLWMKCAIVSNAPPIQKFC